MLRIACLALLLAGIVSWAVRDDASTSHAPTQQGQRAQPTRAQYAQMVTDNASQRRKLKEKYPEVWRDLAAQTRRDIGTCVVTEVVPGMLKADCR